MQGHQVMNRLEIRMGGSTVTSSTSSRGPSSLLWLGYSFHLWASVSSFPSVTKGKQDYLSVHIGLWLRIKSKRGWDNSWGWGWTQQNAAHPNWSDLLHQTSGSPFLQVTWQANPRSNFSWKYCELWSFLGLFKNDYPWGQGRSGMWCESLGREETEANDHLHCRESLKISI